MRRTSHALATDDRRSVDQSSSTVAPRRVAIVLTDGVCHRRLLDLKKIRSYLVANGHTLVDSRRADVVLLYTCGFNQHMEDNAFAEIRRHQAIKPELIVMGCLPHISPARLGLLGLKQIPHRRYDALDQEFLRTTEWRLIAEENHRYRVGATASLLGSISNLSRAVCGLQLRRYDIQVQHGCSSNCAYCADKKSVGESVSKPIDACVSELRRAIRDGYRDIKLVGDDVGSWGVDQGASLHRLLDEMTKVEGRYMLSLKEISLRWLVNGLDDIVRILDRKKIGLLSIGMQSGCDRVLQLMQRGYTQTDIRRVLSAVATRVPITLSAIAGFPTETDEEFDESLDMLTAFPLQGGDVFAYQVRPGTPAAVMEPKVDIADIRRRIASAVRRLSKSYTIRVEPDKIYFDRGLLRRVGFKCRQKLGAM